MITFYRALLPILIVSASNTIAYATPAGFTFGCSVQAARTVASCLETSRSDTEVTFSASPRDGTAFTTNAALSLAGYLRNNIGNIGVSLQMSGYAFDQWWGNGYALAATSWGDNIQVKSNTLADGTPVRIDVVKKLQLEINKGTSGSLTAYINSHPRLLSSLDAIAYNGVYGPIDIVSQVFDFSHEIAESTYTKKNYLNTYVGASIALGDKMYASLLWDFAKPSENSLLAATFETGISAGHSSHVYLSADKNINLVTESGHDFALPQIPTNVPEPSSLALLALACSGWYFIEKNPLRFLSQRAALVHRCRRRSNNPLNISAVES